MYTVTRAQAVPTITGAADAGDVSTGTPVCAAETSLTTETIYTTRVETVYECPAPVPKCPLIEKEVHTFTQTTALGTPVYPGLSSLLLSLRR